MIVSAQLSNAPISHLKLKYMARSLRRRPVDRVIDELTLSPKKSAFILKKLILSAVANAEDKGVFVDELTVENVRVCKGAVLKRWTARARGKADRRLKRKSHIYVELKEGRS